jgi:uncharacterized protein YegJ (DUF2314 family)
MSEPIDPRFIAIRDGDPEMQQAYAQAAETVSLFQEFVERTGDHMCCAKLRFRDPDRSEELGEDRFLFLWLNSVYYHQAERLFSGAFFELPAEFTKWHQVGKRLGFEADDIFDWMVNDDGHLYGGFTLRVVRAHLPEQDRARYDKYTGVTAWEPLPEP